MTSDRLKRMVEKRDKYCWHCGTEYDLVIHHRQNRGMGGRGKSLDRIDNLLLVCSTYNIAMESDAGVASQARDFGHKLQSWNLFSDPVFDQFDLSWWILSEDGSKIRTQAPTYLI